MKLKYSLIVVAFFIMMLLPIVSSVSLQNPLINNPSQGLIIDAPPISTIPVNQSISFDFHVYNASTGVLINDSSLDCSFHLYDKQGFHLVKSPLTYSGEADYFVTVQAGNFTYLGDYAYLANCGSNDYGGFISNSLLSTPKGYAPLGDVSFIFSWILFFAILFSLIFLFLYAIGGMMSLRFDVLDVSLNIGAFFVLFAFKFFASDYLGITIINDILDLAFKISVWTNVVLPLIGFILTLLLGPFLLRKYPQVFGRMPGFQNVYSGQGAMS